MNLRGGCRCPNNARSLICRVFVGAATPDAVSGVSALLQRGLVQPRLHDGGPDPPARRAERLKARGEIEAAPAAHADYVSEVARAGSAGARGPPGGRSEKRAGGARAAEPWRGFRRGCSRHGHHDDSFEALIALTPFLWRFGHTRAGSRWRANVLAEPSLEAERRQRAQAVAAMLLWATNERGSEAEQLALAALETPADDQFAAAARGVLSLAAEARDFIGRALELATEVEATLRRRGDRWHALVSSICISRILATSGRADPERTARNLTEARRSGRYLLAVALVDAGLLALRKGETRGARISLMEALVVADAIGNPIARARGLMALAAVELAEEDAVRGATLLGAADAVRKSIGHVPPTGDAARQKELVAASTRTLGHAAFTHVWRQGQTFVGAGHG